MPRLSLDRDDVSSPAIILLPGLHGTTELFDRFVAYREGIGMEVLPLTGGGRTTFALLLARLRCPSGDAHSRPLLMVSTRASCGTLRLQGNKDVPTTG